MKALRIALQLIRIMYNDLLLDMLVALDDVDLAGMEKLSYIAQDSGCLVDKALDQDLLAGGRGVDRDDQGPDPVHLPVFIFLDQGHIAVDLKSVIVKAVVKGIGVDGRHLAQDGEFPQKFPVVRPAPVGDRQDAVKASALL